MLRTVTLFVAMVVLTGTASAGGDRYKITVTRKENNLYKVDGTSFHIKTGYCFEYAFAESAIMVWNGKGSLSNQLVFVDYKGDKKSECDVDALLVETEPS